MIGDSLIRDLGGQFVDWADVEVRPGLSVGVEECTKTFTINFQPEFWRGVSTIFLLIGTFDIEETEARVFAIKYRALVKIIRARLGDVNLILSGIPPRPRDEKVLGHRTKLFNKFILTVAKDLKVTHHPLYKAFLSHGELKMNYFGSDGLHLSSVANILLAKVVKLYRNRFL